MTGYHADTTMLRRLGVPVDRRPASPRTTSARWARRSRACYLAGVIASGNDANRLFIENARGHGELIVGDIVGPAGAGGRASVGATPASQLFDAIRYPTVASSR